jgi:uncharacterized protein (UPF0305 family)
MKKRKFLQTDFIKFILEKYAQSQDLPDDEIETPDEEGREELKRKLRKLNELEDEEEPTDDEQGDDEIIDELLNEYKRLKRKYESKSNRLPVWKKRSY